MGFEQIFQRVRILLRSDFNQILMKNFTTSIFKYLTTNVHRVFFFSIFSRQILLSKMFLPSFGIDLNPPVTNVVLFNFFRSCTVSHTMGLVWFLPRFPTSLSSTRKTRSPKVVSNVWGYWMKLYQTSMKWVFVTHIIA